MDNIEFLINYLVKYVPDFNREDKVYKNDDKKILRALMNIVDPIELSEEFLEIQDNFLQLEIKEKGITNIDDLRPIGSSAKKNIENPNNIYLWKGDIVTFKADAIVNAANRKMLGCRIPLHYCIDNAIHTFAGLQLRNECNRLMMRQGYDEPTGYAKITGGYNLPSKYIIHTVGPIIYKDLEDEDRRQLASSYYESLKLAELHKLKSIVFCSISTGAFNFPKEIAAEIAIYTADSFLSNSNYLRQVVFNVFSDEDYDIYNNLLKVVYDEKK